ncbi:serine hydrolase domain-containing protein [Aquimonas voraii]|uniref:CubicO group peptidase, beta-lactamase class C family n=1 Tax=Aquimonas voraii TaxID=265719 RepID=A0A1G6STS5_9GAMM|nr:serine hydrolase domain-containing protein [Aquimonas voraii]SDD19676.1 CubicO group peptidase, beta-lactamase class C family [Aquimonas voraii]
MHIAQLTPETPPAEIPPALPTALQSARGQGRPGGALRRRAAAAALWTCAGLLWATLPSAQAQQGPGCDFGPSLQRFEALRQREALPGAALLLGSRQGLLLEHYAGSYSAQTVVAIASASKLLGAVRILQLADRGILDLDAPIGPLLPEFSGDKADMTLDQLFSHTSGYGNDSAAPEITDRSISLAEAVLQIACCRDFPAGYSVGGQFAYGGVSMHIGGRAAEVATGQDWQQGWQQALGAPLGISSIDWQAFGPTTNYMVAGGARSNLRDYGAVLHLLTNEGVASSGARLLSRDSVFELWRDRITDLPVIDPPPTAEPPVRYGLGSWFIPQRPAGRAPLIHSLGAFGFMPWIDFEAGLFGVFMVRGAPGINTRLMSDYEALFVELRAAAEASGCREFERFDSVFADDLEGQGRPTLPE